MKNVHFNIAALILLIILLFSAYSRGMTKGKKNLFFLILLYVSAACTAFDLTAVLIDNFVVNNPQHGAAMTPLLYIFHTMYLLLHSVTAPLYCMFIVAYTDTYYTVIKYKKTLILSTLPIAAVALSLLINPFTGWMFSFENYVYTRNGLFPLLYICAAYYASVGVIYALRHKNLFTPFKLFSIIALVPLTVAAMLLQMIYMNIIIEMYANAVGLLFITMTIQRPEETIDPFTLLRKHSAYANDIKLCSTNKKPITIIMINPVNFDSIQSKFSYEKTNRLLRCFSDMLTAEKKALKLINTDLYYIDRGRFRIVISGDRYEQALDIAERLNNIIKTQYTMSNMGATLYCSICVVRCPEDISDFKSLMSFGMDFHEKMPYTGQVMKACDLLETKRFTLMTEIDSIIESALENHHLQVYYQPIFSVKQNRFVSAEALLRLIDPNHGFIPPDVFITAAERSGAIHRIGDYVTEEVCRFIASDAYKQLGLDYIEINLSVSQCVEEDLVDKVLALLDKYKISPNQINLEVTETAAADFHTVMEDNLRRLSEAGIGISLDDYGTGYSNIKRIISLPLNIVKLDKSFVDDIDNPKMHVVIKNTVKMLKGMNMEIVVEGIETQRMVEQFSMLCCDFIQGYYFSKPIPEQQFVDFILKSHKKSSVSV